VGDKPLPYKLWTTTELHKIYDPQEKTRVTVNGLSRELRRGGFLKACNGMSIKTTTAGYQRLWIIREPESFSLKKPVQFGEYYDKERGGVSGKRQAKF
jgi:hypothetical protein